MKVVHPVFLTFALAACQASRPAPSNGAQALERRASLGVTTSVPSEALALELGLELDVRLQGRLVESVSVESAAEAAGIRSGDVLVRLDDVTLYSQDDIDDFVSVHRPGDRLLATVIRSGAREREELLIELGAEPARRREGIEWQYASLAQLPAALDEARAAKKQVLVGLSGAET